MTTRMERYQSTLGTLRDGWIPQDYEERINVPYDKIAIISDVHAPYHDERFLAYALSICYTRGVDAIVFLGDLADFHLFSHFGVTDHTTLLERELGILEGIVTMASDISAQVFWSQGNHETRFIRHNKFMLGMKEIANMCGLGDLLKSEKLIVSDNPSLDTDNGRIMLTHPASYGRTPLVVPGQLADRFQQHVVSAHAHHAAYGFSPSGNYWCVESGGCFEPSLHHYIQHNVTVHRKWCKGFVILDNGKPMLYTEMDMERELKAR